MGRKTIKKAAAAGALALSLVLLSSFLSCAAGAEIGYNKFRKNLIITLKGVEAEKSVTFVCAEYEGGRMSGVSVHSVVTDSEGKYGTGKTVIEDGKIYRYFFFESMGSLLPVTPMLEITTDTPNGSGNISDGEYTERY